MILFDTFESIAGGGNIMCVCLYQKSVCKKYRTRLQSSATGFLVPDQRHFHGYAISFPFIPIP